MKKIEVDPKFEILKRLTLNQLPFSLQRILNSKPIIVIPSKGQMMNEIQMACLKIKKAGYDIEIKFDKDMNKSDDWKKRNIFIIGSGRNNKFYSKILSYLPKDFSLGDGVFYHKKKVYDGLKQSLLISFENKKLNSNEMSIFIWNSKKAISSMKNIFNYMSNSWYIFDEELSKNPLIEGISRPKLKNSLVWEKE